MGIAAAIGGIFGAFAGGSVLGGIAAAVGGGLLGKAINKLAPKLQSRIDQQRQQTQQGQSRVQAVRERRAAAAQNRVAMSFDGIGNENGKIPFQLGSGQDDPNKLQAQKSIFG